jgi:type IV secretory pathway ATPase VirB11/archaellum biosynthesis ATPase/intein/homing endonuclease
MSKVRELFRRQDGAGRKEPEPERVVEPPEEIRGVVDTYRVPAGGRADASAEVFVVDEDGAGRYLVRLPKLSEEETRALEVLRLNLLDSIPADATGEPREVVADYIWRTSEAAGLAEVVQESHDKLLYFLMRDFAGFWEVDPLMGDDNLEEISVCRFDRPVRVLHRKFSEYMFMETDITYPSEERLQAFVRRLAQLGGTTISLAQPSLEVTLHGRSDRRVTATLGDEISRPGSSYSIRKQRESPITLAQLAAPERARWPALLGQAPPESSAPYEEVHSHKTLSVLMAAYFWLLLERTSNVLIAGESVDHGEPILFRERGRVRLAKIGELVDGSFDRGEEGRTPVEGIEVVCFDPATFRVGWAPVQYVYRHRRSGELVNLSLETGRSVTVTPEHSVFVFRSGEVRCARADEIKVGDSVVTAREIPMQADTGVVVDLVDELKDEEGVYIYGVPRRVFESVPSPRPPLWSDWRRSGRLPIRYAHLLSKEDRPGVELGCRGTPVRLGARMEIDDEMGRLLGYYASGGRAQIDPGRRCWVALSFGEKDRAPISDSTSIVLDRFGTGSRVKADGDSRTVEFSNRMLAALLAKWGGAEASGKRVPEAILNSPPSVRKSFVSAWAAGEHGGAPSPDLANGMAHLLLMDGCAATTPPRRTEKKSQGRIASQNRKPSEKPPGAEDLLDGSLPGSRERSDPPVPAQEPPDPSSPLWPRSFPGYVALTPGSVAAFDQGLPSAAAHGRGDGRHSRLGAGDQGAASRGSRQMQTLQQGLGSARVLRVGKVKPTSEYVYDVSVPGCENFLAGHGGVFCHNTNSGKTTLMNSILALSNPKYKIVTAEDVLEISLPDHLHWERLKTRSYRAGLSPASGRYEYGLPELLKLALRLSPTILSLGEMRGEESETVAAAITLGFSTMTTIHAESAERCVQRLTTPPMRFSEGHVRDISAIATMRKVVLQGGRVVRRVVSVDEVKPASGYGHEIVNVFRYDPSTDSFSPTTPAEVLDRSYRLNEIAASFGWTPAAVQGSLAVRAARITGLIAGGGLDPRALSRMVKEFAVDESKRGAAGGWGSG